MANLTNLVAGLDSELIHAVGTTIFFIAKWINLSYNYAVSADATNCVWIVAERLWCFALGLFNGCLDLSHSSWSLAKECWSYTCALIDRGARALRAFWTFMKMCWRFVSAIISLIVRAISFLWSLMNTFWRLASILTTVAAALLSTLNTNGYSTDNNNNTTESALTCNTSAPICCPNIAWSLSPELGVISALEDDVAHLDGIAPSLEEASRAFVTGTIKFLATRDNVRTGLDKSKLDFPGKWLPASDQLHRTSSAIVHLRGSEDTVTSSLGAIAKRVNECQMDLARLEGRDGVTARLLREIQSLQRAMSLEIARRMAGHVRVVTVVAPSLNCAIIELTMDDLENARELLDSIESDVIALRQSYGQDPCFATASNAILQV